MKILVYVGSPRKQGNTYKLLSYLELLLSRLKIDYDVIKCTKSVTPCQHCGMCTSNYCVIQDDWYEPIKTFKYYDGIILMSPIYFFQFTAQTKAFIDRLGGAGFEGWNKKIISCILTSGSDGYFGGKKLLISSLKRTAMYHKCIYAGCYNKVTNDTITEVNNKDKLGMSILLRKMLRCYNEVNKE